MWVLENYPKLRVRIPDLKKSDCIKSDPPKSEFQFILIVSYQGESRCLTSEFYFLFFIFFPVQISTLNIWIYVYIYIFKKGYTNNIVRYFLSISFMLVLSINIFFVKSSHQHFYMLYVYINIFKENLLFVHFLSKFKQSNLKSIFFFFECYS